MPSECQESTILCEAFFFLIHIRHSLIDYLPLPAVVTAMGMDIIHKSKWAQIISRISQQSIGYSLRTHSLHTHTSPHKSAIRG